jgi:hypothetical protein
MTKTNHSLIIENKLVSYRVAELKPKWVVAISLRRVIQGKTLTTI